MVVSVKDKKRYREIAVKVSSIDLVAIWNFWCSSSTVDWILSPKTILPSLKLLIHVCDNNKTVKNHIFGGCNYAIVWYVLAATAISYLVLNLGLQFEFSECVIRSESSNRTIKHEQVLVLAAQPAPGGGAAEAVGTAPSDRSRALYLSCETARGVDEEKDG